MDDKLKVIVNKLYDNLSEDEKEERYKKQKANYKRICKIFCFTFLVCAIFMVTMGLTIFFSVKEDREIALILIIPGPIIFSLVSTFMLIRTNKIYKDKEYAIKLSLKSEANKILIEESIGNFTIDKELNLYTDSGYKKILIDTQNRQFVFFNGYNYSKKIQFKNVLNYEVYEDGKSVVKGSAGKALVGGAFFGVTGAIIGGSGKRKINNYCSVLKLLIRVNDIDSPLIEIPFVNSSCNKDGISYKNYIKSIQETCALFEFMINYKKPENIVETEEIVSIKDKLIELKQLLDEGLINEEDYENKKQEILKRT